MDAGRVLARLVDFLPVDFSPADSMGVRSGPKEEERRTTRRRQTGSGRVVERMSREGQDRGSTKRSAVLVGDERQVTGKMKEWFHKRLNRHNISGVEEDMQGEEICKRVNMR